MSDDYNVSADELLQFVEQLETLEREKKAKAEEQKELMAEAKSRGFDTKAIKKIMAIRAADKDKLDEEEAILDTYKAALGMD